MKPMQDSIQNKEGKLKPIDKIAETRNNDKMILDKIPEVAEAVCF